LVSGQSSVTFYELRLGFFRFALANDVFFGIAFVPRVLISTIKQLVSDTVEKLAKSTDHDRTDELSIGFGPRH
jgi:hypothetical protein